MSRRRREAGRVVLIALALGSLGAACRSAASVILDLPPPKPQAQQGQGSGATAETRRPVDLSAVEVAQDTVRPPVERTLNPDSVLALLPRDSGGNVDWGAAVRDGTVKPRRRLPGRPVPPDISGFAYDFRYEASAKPFEAMFPHSTHVAWMQCRTCHPAVFPYRNMRVDMAAINKGESCGVCHRTVAFPASACFRCHPAMPPMGSSEPKLKADVVFARDSSVAGASSPFPPSVFPHWVHRIRYTCGVCHPDTFPLRAPAPTLTMAALQRGEACGMCHNGGLAFALTECTRCHVPPVTAGGEGK